MVLKKQMFDCVLITFSAEQNTEPKLFKHSHEGGTQVNFSFHGTGAGSTLRDHNHSNIKQILLKQSGIKKA